jgi:hypothetical protein
VYVNSGKRLELREILGFDGDEDVDGRGRWECVWRQFGWRESGWKGVSERVDEERVGESSVAVSVSSFELFAYQGLPSS